MKNPVKRVAAIHDLSGFGRASLTVVIPTLSGMGIQVCPIPTAVLSAHGKFHDFHFADLTPHMQPIIAHWKQLDLKFEAIYSGFLGSHKQVEIVEEFIEHFKSENTLVVVDPVMGDNGSTYSSISDEIVSEMKRLIQSADVITPNLTELHLLLDIPYKETASTEEIKSWLKQLSEQGPEIVIATSIPEPAAQRKTSVIAYSAKDGRYWKVSCNYLPANFPGTGDAFASVITGALLQGDSLPIAMDRAMHFTSYGVRATFGYDYNTDEGILLERVLSTLNAPVQLSTYELLD